MHCASLHRRMKTTTGIGFPACVGGSILPSQTIGEGTMKKSVRIYNTVVLSVLTFSVFNIKIV